MTLASAIVGAIVFIVGFLFLALPFGMAWLCERLWQQLWSRMTSPVANNQILYWPVALAIICPLLFAWLLQLYQLFWFPVISEYFFITIGLGVAAIWVGSVIVACRLMIQWAVARQWRTVLSAIILPSSFLLVLASVPVVAPFLWSKTETAAQYAKFFMAYPDYLADVEKRPATVPRFIVWMPLYGDRGILYDETDEIASDHPSEAWKNKADVDIVPSLGYRHIIGHFYFVTLRYNGP